MPYFIVEFLRERERERFDCAVEAYRQTSTLVTLCSQLLISFAREHMGRRLDHEPQTLETPASRVLLSHGSVHRHAPALGNTQPFASLSWLGPHCCRSHVICRSSSLDPSQVSWTISFLFPSRLIHYLVCTTDSYYTFPLWNPVGREFVFTNKEQRKKWRH